MENAENDQKNPVEKLGLMSDEMMAASKDMFVPGAFDKLDLKLNITTSGGPMDIQLNGTAAWDQLSEKGIARARRQGYSKGDTVRLAFLNTSENKKLDIVGKKGGKCDVCGRVLFEGDGMLVKFSHTVDAEGSHQTISKQARIDEFTNINPHLQSGTGYTYLVCNTDECRKKIDDTITKRIQQGDIPQPKSEGGGCFIATATYGSPLAGEVRTLYEFRDAILLKSEAGRKFVSLYYRLSPALSRQIERHEILKKISAIILKPVILLARYRIKTNR